MITHRAAGLAVRHSGAMPTVITAPVRIPVPGGKRIEEYVGAAATGHGALSVAQMHAPPGWSEPPQTPTFTEVTLVLAGEVVVEADGGPYRVGAGQAIVTAPGETVRYSVGDQGAQYVAVCVPAFSEHAAHRQEDL